MSSSELKNCVSNQRTNRRVSLLIFLATLCLFGATLAAEHENNAQGVRCTSCRPGYFNLNRDLETGCMKCFCMNITNVCTSSNYYRDEVSSYGGFLRFSLQYTASSCLGRNYTDLDVVLISLFLDSQDSQVPSRETFLTVLADLSAILIRATYHQSIQSVTLRDLRMDIAVPTVGIVAAPEVERCTCPDGYSGLSCQSCAPGFVRVEDPRTALGRCTRCNYNGHSNSCDPNTGVCQSCQHNTEGDRCERCSRGYYGDPSAGTPNDCRPCACPLTLPSNNFSPTCYLDTADNRVTCDRCPAGYTGRDCGQCAPGYSGNPRQPGGACSRAEVIVTPNNVREPLGSTVQFQCIPRGRGPFNVVWSRIDGQSLPGRAVIGTGPPYELTISDVDYTDSGRYMCTVTRPDGSSRGVGVLIVERPELPIKVRIEEPTRLLKEPGQMAILTCVAIQYSSAANYVLTWRKDGGYSDPLPSHIITDGEGRLVIRSVLMTDKSSYHCHAENSEGNATARAVIYVPRAPAPIQVIVRRANITGVIGQSEQMVCESDTANVSLVWSREGGLPPETRQANGVLTFSNIQPSYGGTYICSGTVITGRLVGRSNATLFVIDTLYTRPTARIEPERLTIVSGTTGTLRCVVRGDTLRFIQASPEDRGGYICTATNVEGTIQTSVIVEVERREPPLVELYPEVSLTKISGENAMFHCRVVQAEPVINNEDYPTTLGLSALLICDVAFYSLQVTWVKENGDLPSEHEGTESKHLFIPRVKEADAGKYNCKVGGLVPAFYLVVEALVPYFDHTWENPYLEYATLQDAYQDLDIMLSFHPESTDGLLLYNGQYDADSGDFVCFGLQQQVPEFRFDVGSGPAIIRGNRSLELNKWHTVHLKLNRGNGTLLVNDEPAYQGIAPGQYEALDLGAPFYLGSVPDFNKIPRTVGYSKGLVGRVSQVQVKGVNMNLGEEVKSLKNVVQYDACLEEQLCLNDSTCRPFNIRFGYLCECEAGFMGENCELNGEACSPGLCGSQGRCVNLPRQRYSCICPAGLAGDGCRRFVEISDPAFNKTSFFSYPYISDGLMTAHVELFINPRSLDDGIILYNSKTLEGNHDFISLSIKNKFLEFRFNTGSGTAILKSRQPLRVNDWTRVEADRKGRDGLLIINNDEPINEQVAANDEQVYAHLARGDVIRGSTPSNKTVGLNLDRPLYLGGVDPAETINPGVNVTSGVVGCICEVSECYIVGCIGEVSECCIVGCISEVSGCCIVGYIGEVSECCIVGCIGEVSECCIVGCIGEVSECCIVGYIGEVSECCIVGCIGEVSECCIVGYIDEVN
ncbi:hypothetical protein Btru_063679 [Bulinus truncatus]|nr:hypothetical protein Btru_063679 [Bulinus truncatus]